MATQLKPEPVSGLDTAGSSAPARPASRGPSRAALPIAVFTAAACLYLSTLSQHYSEGEDSAAYVAQVTRAARVSDCFRPNHLLYLAFNRLVYDGFRLVGYTGNAALPMKVVSVLAGAISLCLLLLILRQVGVTDRLGLVWVAVITSCYGFWSYSTQAETYTLPIPFLLIALMIFVGLAEGPFSPWQFFWFGVSNALVTLLQQMHVVLYPVLILAPVALWYRRRAEIPLGRLVTGLAVFGAASALIDRSGLLRCGARTTGHERSRHDHLLVEGTWEQRALLAGEMGQPDHLDHLDHAHDRGRALHVRVRLVL